MTRLEEVSRLYAAAATISTSDGAVELVAVADPLGAYLHSAVRRLGQAVGDEDPGIWGDLLAASRALRWRRATEPVPARCRPDSSSLAATVVSAARRSRHSADAETAELLDELAERAKNLDLDEAIAPPVGKVLLESLVEVGWAECALVAATPRAAAAARRWLVEQRHSVPVVSSRRLADLDVHEQAYLLGPPQLLGLPPLAAPRAERLSYLFPSWVDDRSLPRSTFSDLAEGGARPQARSYPVGGEPHGWAYASGRDDPLQPQPIWGVSSRGRRPNEEEALARRVLLAGGIAIMLDREGESIRTLDPVQPAGDRIELRDVSAVSAGTYLVLREGETESAALYARAMSLLGPQAEAVERSQQEWKRALRARLAGLARSEAVRQLTESGVRAARQVNAWTRETVARPQLERDFDLLLRWLGLPWQPYHDHANLLRRARSRAAAEVRQALEAALGGADMLALDRDGWLRLDIELGGFASIIATRVIAISPHEEAVPDYELRVPFEDQSGRWLE